MSKRRRQTEHTIEDPYLGSVRVRSLSPDELREIDAEVARGLNDAVRAFAKMPGAKGMTLAKRRRQVWLMCRRYELIKAAVIDEEARSRLLVTNPPVAGAEAFVRLGEAIRELSGAGAEPTETPSGEAEPTGVLRECTAFLDDGHTPCGGVASCTTVTVRAGGREFTHYVCPSCRERMDLPDHDTVFEGGRWQHEGGA